MTSPSRTSEPVGYDRAPAIELTTPHTIWAGAEVWEELRAAMTASPPAVVAIDAYPGGDTAALLKTLRVEYPHAVLVDVEDDAALPDDELEALIEPHLTDDRVFGVMSHFVLQDFYDPLRLRALADRIESSQ